MERAVELIKVEEGSTPSPTQALRDQLSVFRFNDASTPSLRRSPRNHGLPKVEEEESSLPTLTTQSHSSKKRSASAAAEASDSKKAKGRDGRAPRVKREIAPLDKYAHLSGLNDHLGQEVDMLDVMFCGINPGQRSATVGHHFAHPTNHFWKCLYGSGLTERLLSPTEDGDLPDNYRLGLTNLVERPSAQAAELANTEFTAGVPALLRKILSRRPRFVCFVGKGIWESFIKAAAPPPSRGDGSSLNGAEASLKVEETTATITTDGESAVTATRKKTVARQVSLKRKAKAPFAFDLQPYKVVHSDPDATVRETLFFVVASTSGLVAGYQLPAKIQQFALLKQRLDELKSGDLDTSSMTTIPIPAGLV